MLIKHTKPVKGHEREFSTKNSLNTNSAKGESRGFPICWTTETARELPHLGITVGNSFQVHRWHMRHILALEAYAQESGLIEASKMAWGGALSKNWPRGRRSPNPENCFPSRIGDLRPQQATALGGLRASGSLRTARACIRSSSAFFFTREMVLERIAWRHGLIGHSDR